MLLHAGEIHGAAGDYEGAEALLKASLDAAGSFEAALKLAELLRDRPDEAQTYAAQAVLLAPDAEEKATAYDMQAKILGDLGDASGSRKSAAQALVLFPQDLEALRVLADLDRNQATVAAAEAEKAREVADSVPLWYRASADRLCAQIYVGLGMEAQAVGELRKAIALDPLDVDALQMLVEIKQSHPDFHWAPGAASEGFASAELSTEPVPSAGGGDLETLRALFEARRAAHQKRRALDFARRFAASIPVAPPWERYDAYRKCADLWIELGRRRAVPECLGPLQSLRSSRQKNQELPENSLDVSLDGPTANDAADLYTELGDAPSAQAVLEWALRSHPDDVETLRRIAQGLLTQGKPEAALPYARRMLAAAGNEPRERILMAMTGTELMSPDSNGRYTLKVANRDIRKKLEDILLRERESAFETYGQVLDRLGRFQEELKSTRGWIEAAAAGSAREQAQAWREQARVQSELRDPAAQARSLERVLELEPEDAGTAQELTEVDERRGETRLALDDAHRWVQAASQGTAENRARAWREQAELQAALGDWPGAARSLRAVLALEPQDWGSWERLTELETQGGQVPKALSDAQAWVAAARPGTPKDQARAWRGLARIQEAAGAWSDEAQTLKRALSLGPSEQDLWEEVTDLELRAGRKNEALVDVGHWVTSAARATPQEQTRAWQAMVRVQYALGDVTGARHSLEQALKRDPDDPGSLEALAEADLQAGRKRAALRHATRLIEAEGKATAQQRAWAWGVKARVQAASGDAAGELESLRHALALRPDDPGTLAPLAELELRRGDKRQALADARHWVEISGAAPPEARALAWREVARVQQALGDDAAAAESLDRALSLPGQDLSVAWDLAVLTPEPPASLLDRLGSMEPLEKSGRAQWLVIRGFLRGKRGLAAEADEDFRAAAGLDPAAACASPLFQRRPDVFPLDYFDRCLESLPKDAGLHADRGVARYQAGLRPQALEDFRTALRLDPGLSVASLSLASALLADKRVPEASLVVERALSADRQRSGEIYQQLLALRAGLRPLAAATSDEK